MTFNHRVRWLRLQGVGAIAAGLVIAIAAIAGTARATAAGDDFNIQVSPSPIVVTLTPGQNQTTTLTVRNFTNHTETLYPSLKGFTVSKNSTDVRLLDSAPGDMQDWVSFDQSSLVLQAGASQQLVTRFATPKNVGFNYAFAIELSRSPNAQAPADGIHLQGSVAVFCLVNISRPDAKKQFNITSLTSSRGHYSYLPATFSVAVKNNGNVIDQPQGTLFIQRSFDSSKPIAALPLNGDGRYILPGTERTFQASWTNGFPVYISTSNGKRHLSWSWKHFSDLRFGRYVAKAVIIYNDGHGDVPLIASTTFWVIPWMVIFMLIIILATIVAGLVGWGHLIFKGTKKVRSYAHRRK